MRLGTSRICVRCGLKTERDGWGVVFAREHAEKKVQRRQPALRNIPSIPQPSQASGRREREKEQIHFTLPLSKHPCTYSCPQHPTQPPPARNCSRRGTPEKLSANLYSLLRQNALKTKTVLKCKYHENDWDSNGLIRANPIGLSGF